LQGGDLIRATILSGFDAIWIDRFAYLDEGEKLISSLTAGKVKQLDMDNSRFVVLDLRNAAADLKASIPEPEFRRQASALLGSEILVEWQKGFYGEEQSAEGRSFRWAQNQAKIAVRNSGEAASTVCISFTIASPAEGRVKLEGTGGPVAINTASVPQSVKFPLSLGSGETRTLQFSTGLPCFDAPGESRQLYFYVMDFALTPMNHTISCVSH